MENFINHLKSDSGSTNQFIFGIMRQNFSNDKYWEEVCPLLNFSDTKVENWVLENIGLFNLKYLVKYGHNLTYRLLDHVLDYIELVDRDDLIRYQHFSNSQLEQYIGLVGVSNVNWSLIQEYQHIAKQEFVNEYEQYLDWDLISENQFMDLKFLLTNKSKISWLSIPSNHHLQPIINNSFLKLFADTNIWDGIGWLDNDMVTVDMLINDFAQYLTYKSIQSIQKGKDREITLEQNAKLLQMLHELR